jgi:HlyD family secretion protein
MTPGELVPMRCQRAFGEVRHDQPNLHVGALIGAGLLLSVVFLGGFGTWAMLAPLKGAAVAAGVVKVSGNRKVVQHLEGGIVKEILVRDGSRVAGGQPLLRLDDTSARADVTRLTGRLLAAMALDARLDAEQTGAEGLVFPDELVMQKDRPPVVDILAAQTALFDARRRAVLGSEEVLRRQIAQLKEEIAGLRSIGAATRSQLTLIEEEAEDSKFLIEKGLTRKPRHLALLRAKADLAGKISEQEAGVARARQKIAEAEEKILQLRREHANEIAAASEKVRTELFDLRQLLLRAQDVLMRTIVRAPCPGVVFNLSVHGTEAVISAREPLLEILPDGDRLIVEALVKPTDIDVIREGAVAMVRLTAYSPRRSPPVKGRVALVSADRLVKEDVEPYYRVEIVLDGAEGGHEGELLIAGMPAEVTIETEEQTLAEYLSGPLLDGFWRALRESN